MSTTETKDTSRNHQPEKQTPAMRSEKSEKPAEHPITRAITSLIHKLRDFEDCADEYVSAAGKMQVERIKRVTADLGNSVDLLKNKDKRTKVLGLKQLVDGMPKIVQVIRADPARVLRESLFVGMFSAFDAFTGDLLRALFLKKPALFSSSKRQIEVSALMESDTLDDLKRRLIDDEIEAFRRESYVEQFSRLEQMFGLKLRSFSRWPDFVERSQRRNLLTHCDGVVSDQYLCMCKKVGMPCTETLGTRLGISLKYLKETVEVLMEVGLKLGHTLWRKVLPDELEQADKSLNNEIYERLQDEKWDPALTLAEFAIEQPRISDDAMKKTFTVNYTIAAKFGGQEEKAKEFLASLDWTAAAPRFQLAKAVLEDRFDDAAAIMLQVGKSDEFIAEHSYHVFPLFRTFRLQESFLRAYEKIFGYPFAVRVEQTAGDTKMQLEQATSEKTDQGASPDAAPQQASPSK